ncbi:MAG: IS66 family transposase [Mycoplasmataceae bacterium]|jgi:hypothetical protein|nr:IS66 family transposase [Mycoplasmataceae bacterium]
MISMDKVDIKELSKIDPSVLTTEQLKEKFFALQSAIKSLHNESNQLRLTNNQLRKIDNRHQIELKKQKKMIEDKDEAIVILTEKIHLGNLTALQFVELLIKADFIKMKISLRTFDHKTEKNKKINIASNLEQMKVSPISPVVKAKRGPKTKEEVVYSEEELKTILDCASEVPLSEDPKQYGKIPPNALIIGEYAIFYEETIERVKRFRKVKITSSEEFKKLFPNACGIDNYAKGLIPKISCYMNSNLSHAMVAWIMNEHINCNVAYSRIAGYLFPDNLTNKSVIANSQEKLALILKPLILEAENKLKECHIVQSDETTMKVLNYDEDNKLAINNDKKRTKSYIYCLSSGLYEQHRIVLYRYFTTRKSEESVVILDKANNEYLVCDGYSGYNAHHGKLVRCWAHARRSFVEIVEVNQKEVHKRVAELLKADDQLLKENEKIIKIAQYILDKISYMYALEKEFQQQKYNYEKIKVERERLTRPVVKDLLVYLEEHKNIKDERLHQAINYILKFEIDLTRFFEDGRLPLDNNLSERNIRNIVLYRNNSLFCGSEDGANTLCALKTVNAIARLYSLEPVRYITFLLDKAVAEGHYTRERINKQIVEKYVYGDISKYAPWTNKIPKEIYYSKDECKRIIELATEYDKNYNSKQEEIHKKPPK